ncbi:MAG: 2' O-ribose methyltransferase [Thelocarpon impressellum]|nr:MAG: 2' O-ribose methyltransferase [Thelocarpon impressellum]
MLSRRLISFLTWTPLVDGPGAAAARRSSTCYAARTRIRAPPARPPRVGLRASSSSSKRWQNRQGRDKYSREARVQGLKSRAAFKLLEIDSKYRIFRPGQTVVDLGYAPGSWSQVAVSRTTPGGRVIGIDLIPAAPPRGVSTIQGNFLSPAVQDAVKRFVRDPSQGLYRAPPPLFSDPDDVLAAEAAASAEEAPAQQSRRARDAAEGKVVDVLLSDMCAPWPQLAGFRVPALAHAYAASRMMNASGISFRDHAGSMDLCASALAFARQTLRPGGAMIAKFYAGAEDRALEARLKRCFRAVHREKPDASRADSREAYFVALGMRDAPAPEHAAEAAGAPTREVGGEGSYQV